MIKPESYSNNHPLRREAVLYFEGEPLVRPFFVHVLSGGAPRLAEGLMASPPAQGKQIRSKRSLL